MVAAALKCVLPAGLLKMSGHEDDLVCISYECAIATPEKDTSCEPGRLYHEKV